MGSEVEDGELVGSGRAGTEEGDQSEVGRPRDVGKPKSATRAAELRRSTSELAASCAGGGGALCSVCCARTGFDTI